MLEQSKIAMLLAALKETVKEGKQVLENNAETWNKIGSRESFSELGFASEDELKEWIENNPYSNI